MMKGNLFTIVIIAYPLKNATIFNIKIVPKYHKKLA